MIQPHEDVIQNIYTKIKLIFTQRDIIFLSLFVLVYISIYYVPASIGLIIDVAIAIYCYRSKYPFILLFLFVILNTRMDGMLDINRLPRISMAGNSTSLLDFLTIALWLKVIQNYKIIFRSTFGTIFLTIYFVLFSSVLINALGAGVDRQIAISMIRTYSYYICYFYVLVAYKDLSDFNFIIKVLFLITIIVLANQLSLVFSEKQLNTLVLGQEMGGDRAAKARFINYYGDYQSDKSRGAVMDGADPLLLLISCLALFGISRERKMRNFMLISAVIVIMTGLIEAGRGYMVFIFLPFLAYTKNIQNMFHISKILVFTIILMLLIFIVIGGFGFTYFHDILLRLSGIYKVLNTNTRGEVETAVGRIDAAQDMFNVIAKSPVIGHGFSSQLNALDNDLGFENTIIVMGIVGLLVYLYLIIKFISTCLSIIRRISTSNPFRISVFVFMYAMVGFFLGYATSQDFFSSNVQNIAFIAIFLGFAELIFREALNYEKTHIRGTIQYT